MTYAEELLAQLRQCANNLLLAYDIDHCPNIWQAFEHTADACQQLMNNSAHPATLH